MKSGKSSSCSAAHLGHVLRQSSEVNFGGFGARASPLSIFIVAPFLGFGPAADITVFLRTPRGEAQGIMHPPIDAKTARPSFRRGTHVERERLRLSWRRRPGLGEPEELEELEECELEEPDLLDPDELEPLEEPELEPELLLEDELDPSDGRRNTKNMVMKHRTE